MINWLKNIFKNDYEWILDIYKSEFRDYSVFSKFSDYKSVFSVGIFKKGSGAERGLMQIDYLLPYIPSP